MVLRVEAMAPRQAMAATVTAERLRQHKGLADMVDLEGRHHKTP